jgi:hypothetical protein
MARKKVAPKPVVTCPSCGHDADPDVGPLNFCPECGTDLRAFDGSASAALLGALVTAYLWRTLVRSDPADARIGRRAPVYLGVGLLVFIAGNLVLLPNSTMTGINNRAFIAAALGVALMLVGALGWPALSLAERRGWGGAAFSVGIAVLCVSGFLTVHTVAQLWSESYRRQLAVLEAIREQWPSLPSGTSFILDGVCPYIGPGIVFDTTWDLFIVYSRGSHGYTISRN